MRISTANAFDTSIAQLQKRQNSLSDAMLRLTSGKRVNRASDDPAAAARSERMQALQARNATDQRSINASQRAMSIADSMLGDATDLLLQARDQLLQASNGSLSPADRRSLATALRELREQLLAVANSGDGADGYVFGGQGTVGAPFRDTPGGVVFGGMPGQNNISSSEFLPTTLDGKSVWLQARTGNGVFETRADPGNQGSAIIDAGRVIDPQTLQGNSYSVQFSLAADGSLQYGVWTQDPSAPVPGLTDVPYESGQAITVDGLSFTISGTPANGDRFSTVPSRAELSIFDALDRAVSALADENQSEASATQAAQFGLRDMDAIMNRMLAARAEVGGVLNRLDTRGNQLEDETLAARTAQSDAEDLDLVTAISHLQNEQTAMQAALQSYATVQRMSLMQYLNG